VAARAGATSPARGAAKPSRPAAALSAEEKIRILPPHPRLARPGRSPPLAFPPGLSVVQQAVGGTGLPQVPMHARARLVTDHGSGDLLGAFEASLRALGIRLICGSPHHPQTPGKLEHVSRDAQSAADRLVDRDWKSSSRWIRARRRDPKSTSVASTEPEYDDPDYLMTLTQRKSSRPTPDTLKGRDQMLVPRVRLS